MKQAFLSIWKRKNAAIAAASVIMIAVHFIFHSIYPLLIILIGPGVLIFAEVLQKLFKRDTGADILAALSILTALILKEYLAGAFIVLMLSGGQALEEFAIGNASSVLKALAKRMPSRAHKKESNQVIDVGIDQIKVGDTIVIYPHEICPVDGAVIEGHGTMDESYLTGEPFQMDKAPGSPVISGAINGDTTLTIRAEKLAVDSRYSKIMNVMKMSEANKPQIRRLGDQLGAFYAPFALAVALITWALTGNPTRFLAVLVIATPCPLLIGIPVAIIGSISLSARRGIVIKNSSVLEQVEKCTTAIFDKTGTLTYGKPKLSEIICAESVEEREVLSLAASVEKYSKHPLARAIHDAASERGVALHEPEEVREIPGQGLRGIASGKEVRILGRAVSEGLNFLGLEHLPSSAQGLECVVILNGRYAALFRFRDTPRQEGMSFIKHLNPKHRFNRSIIVSGDRESEVRYLAEKIGISEVFFQKSPEQKVAIVKEETARAKTLFVGDGINDAPALMMATVGVAIGQNSDITSQASGAVIMDSSLTKVDELIHIGARMRRIALQSAIGGMVLSFIGMAFAAAGHISPVGGAILQEGIDLLAVINALRAAWPPKELSDFKI